MPRRDAILRLPSEGNVEADLLQGLLGSLHAAHSGYLAFERLAARPWYPDILLPPRYLMGSTARPGDPFSPDSMVLSTEQLIVGRVELGSPGFWEFIGCLNPLEVTRQYLADRHQRRQDREYREAAEARRLGLENDLLEIEVVRRQLDLARENGVREEDLIPLLNQWLEAPLRRLGALQDRGVIDGTKGEVRHLSAGGDEDTV